MDLWQLHIFTKVVELGSFSKAAQAIHLSQPTVSSHIKDLEDSLGCRLLDRLGRKAAPTKGGEILFSFAKRLLALRDEAQSAMAAFLGKPTGSLAMGGSNIPGCYVLPKVIGAFTRAYPEVSITLFIGDTASVTEDILEGSVEVGVVGALVPNKQLVQEQFMEDRMSLIIPRGHPLAGRKSVSMDDVKKHPFILREPGSGTRKFFEKALANAGFALDSLHVMAQLGSTEAVREAIKAGVGLSVLSNRAVAGELADKSLCALPITGLDLNRFFYLVRSRQRTPSPLCQYFCDFLKTNAAAEFSGSP